MPEPITLLIRGHRRQVRQVDRRLHVEVRPVRNDQVAALRRAIADRVGAVEGVAWVDWNPFTSRLVVGCGEPPPGIGAVVAALDAAERDVGIDAPLDHDASGHPADTEPLTRAVLEIAADAAGFGVALAASLLPVPSAVLAVDFAAVIGELQNAPPLRRFVDRTLGPGRAELVLAVGSSVAQGLARNPLTPVVGAVYHSLRLGELRARQAAWLAREEELHRGPVEWPEVVELPVRRRPAPLPDSAADRAADTTLVTSLGVFAAALPLTGGLGSSLGALSVGLPKAARLGREAFAGRVTARLSDEDAVVARPERLRLLGKADCLFVEGALLDTDGDALLELVAHARAAGLLVVADGSPGGALDAVVDRVEPGEDVGAIIRRLQEESRVVLAVGRAASGLAEADCFIGLTGAGRPVPWSAHVLGGDTFAAAHLVLSTCRQARQVEQVSAWCTLVGGGAGAVLALGNLVVPVLPPPLTAVDVAALVAIAHGYAIGGPLRSRDGGDRADHPRLMPGGVGG